MLFTLIYVAVVINRGGCLSKNTQDEKSNPSPRQNHCPVTLEGRVYVISFLLTVITSLSCVSVPSVQLNAIQCVRPQKCYPISVPMYVRVHVISCTHLLTVITSVAETNWSRSKWNSSSCSYLTAHLTTHCYKTTYDFQFPLKKRGDKINMFV